ncbi:hypothetical protein [Stutzerimonas nitrititolerans]|uniref:hypothetical protein n=1 Tax=Stutzerimonas nitrititolerans TaxID=2482751 RepID=UPI00289D1AE7|nr:hypothetical protein [Stutzerimonas nitrititolerans]
MDFFISTPGFFSDLPEKLGWTVIGSIITCLIFAGVNLWNNRQTIGMQRLANARAASTFIADKRQKWIDDLRYDMSKLLSLTQEISEAWKQVYWKCGSELDEHGDIDPQGVHEYCESLRLGFLRNNAPRDSEHHQLLMRVLLRLNKCEEAHQNLIRTLTELRISLGGLAAAALRGEYADQKLFDSIEATVALAMDYSTSILKEEWQRLKHEVADPHQLIKAIMATSKPKGSDRL